MISNIGHNHPRLYPSRKHSRYYILTLLRKKLDTISKAYLSSLDSPILLDYGCGTSPYYALVQSYVSQYIRADLPDNERADITITSQGLVDIVDGTVDVVFSTQVLEHVTNPAHYLEECYRILKPNGLLVLSTHGYWKYHPDPQDLWRWTSQGLQEIVKSNGFQTIEISGLMGLAPTGLQLLQDAILSKLPPFLQSTIALFSQILMQLLDKLHTDGQRSQDACVFVIVAQKKL